MPDINNMTKDMSKLKKKILTELSLLLKMHSDFEKEVATRFKEEYNRNSKKMDSLQDFYHLKYVSTKSLKAVKTAHNLLSTVDDLSRFEIEEEDIITGKVKG
jgi:hypothetical protein